MTLTQTALSVAVSHLHEANRLLGYALDEEHPNARRVLRKEACDLEDRAHVLLDWVARRKALRATIKRPKDVASEDVVTATATAPS